MCIVVFQFRNWQIDEDHYNDVFVIPTFLCAKNFFGIEMYADASVNVIYGAGTVLQRNGESVSCIRHFTKDNVLNRCKIRNIYS